MLAAALGKTGQPAYGCFILSLDLLHQASNLAFRFVFTHPADSFHTPHTDVRPDIEEPRRGGGGAERGWGFVSFPLTSPPTANCAATGVRRISARTTPARRQIS